MLTLIAGGKTVTILKEGVIGLSMTFPVIRVSQGEIQFQDHQGNSFYVTSNVLTGPDCRTILDGYFQA
jgi:hypothetical protein